MKYSISLLLILIAVIYDIRYLNDELSVSFYKVVLFNLGLLSLALVIFDLYGKNQRGFLWGGILFTAIALRSFYLFYELTVNGNVSILANDLYYGRGAFLINHLGVTGHIFLFLLVGMVCLAIGGYMLKFAITRQLKTDA
ncbi:hypothetical protein HG263_00635 [Pseudoalteromonas sp. JBTF-M23]|uniref:Uncharacterized protein n=1 Tax=Pseudoalteromonas caenipelagi TaxID=2726988 RepID=A0A849V766_9GAMM|nr:hypothetical protein [Pseudoalteromonas caenipelagi]NOU49056.1 hypothetical protein [Pseudoalteromonas caenipelagi]